MDAEIRYSSPKVCMNCGGIIRIKYLNGEYRTLVEVDPIHKPTKKSPNPIYELHKCEEE